MTAPDDVRARFEAWSKGNNLDLMTNWREDDLALVSVGTLMKLAAHSGEVRELVEALRDMREDWDVTADAHRELGYSCCADTGVRCSDELKAALAKFTRQE